MPQLLQLLEDEKSEVRVAGANVIAKLVEHREFPRILQFYIVDVHFKPNCVL